MDRIGDCTDGDKRQLVHRGNAGSYVRFHVDRNGVRISAERKFGGRQCDKSIAAGDWCVDRIRMRAKNSLRPARGGRDPLSVGNHLGGHDQRARPERRRQSACDPKTDDAAAARRYGTCQLVGETMAVATADDKDPWPGCDSSFERKARDRNNARFRQQPTNPHRPAAGKASSLAASARANIRTQNSTGNSIVEGPREDKSGSDGRPGSCPSAAESAPDQALGRPGCACTWHE